LVAKYGDLQNWKNQVGTGPFMLSEYVPGSLITQIRNPGYWEKDPVGPGTGNQLPYLDNVRQLIIPDASTRLAALRTAKIDWISNLTADDAANAKKGTSRLLQKSDTSYQGRGTPLQMRTDKAPFNDIRVRKAMMLATDYQGILKGLFGGQGQIVTNPYSKVKGYEELYLGLEDNDFPPEAKELYTYSPDKAKQLLKDAGYPNGFKATLLLTSTNQAEIDYYSVIKDMWAKVGIEVTFDLKDNGAATNIRNARSYESMVTSGTGPVATFFMGSQFVGESIENESMINDPVLKKAVDKVRLAGVTDLHQAMKIFREEVSKYAVTQAYVIPNVIGTSNNLWWPWLKNYSGEMTVGFDDSIWAQYIWYDQAAKESIGH
jgi:peptide/nickel transport system substrate-binding protein